MLNRLLFYWLYYYSCPNFSLCPPPPGTPHSLWKSFPCSSCPWVMHINSLASPFPILFLTSLCLCCTYQFILNPCIFFPFSPSPLSTDNPLNDLHIYFGGGIQNIHLFIYLFNRCSSTVVSIFTPPQPPVPPLTLPLFGFVHMSFTHVP